MRPWPLALRGGAVETFFFDVHTEFNLHNLTLNLTLTCFRLARTIGGAAGGGRDGVVVRPFGGR